MRPGPWQILICVIIVALLFGAKKIPEIARSLGKAKGEFKKGLEEGDAPEKPAAAPSADATGANTGKTA